MGSRKHIKLYTFREGYSKDMLDMKLLINSLVAGKACFRVEYNVKALWWNIYVEEYYVV